MLCFPPLVSLHYITFEGELSSVQRHFFKPHSPEKSSHGFQWSNLLFAFPCV